MASSVIAMNNERNYPVVSSLAVAGPELMRNAALVGWWTLLGVAVLIFIYVQRYLQDPLRHQLDAEWYAKFEAHQRERYSSFGLGWRARDLRDYFATSPKHSGLQGGPAGSAGPRLPLMYCPIA
jgi:hypothetical protein